MITFLVQPEALVAADTPIWDVIDRCRKHRNRRCLSKQMIEFFQLFQCIMSNKSHTAVKSFRFNDISSKFGVMSVSDLLHGEGVVCTDQREIILHWVPHSRTTCKCTTNKRGEWRNWRIL